RVTDSTNARARELAAAGAPHGTVVTADEQTEGRGRQGRTWVAPRDRALLYSLLVRSLGDRPLLPLAAALAVCETAEALTPGIECKVKWPNDVQVDGRKLAGILIEARPQDDWAVIGVGLNLTIEPEELPPELRNRATSLAPTPGETQTTGNRCRLRCTAVLSATLERWIDAGDEAILAAWEARNALRGREVAWDGGSGVAGGIDGRGNLVVATSGGTVTLNAGEVHLSA
ncbi:MAG TPA: biotin--[acetyl-CoA-carboxylase] ligase, partial [Solirubrobacterales bacterium]|nr:biotin--[acetyl-CoA-carboxylase] ligase [Solirubrobacterales bacterium]